SSSTRVLRRAGRRGRGRSRGWWTTVRRRSGGGRVRTGGGGAAVEAGWRREGTPSPTLPARGRVFGWVCGAVAPLGTTGTSPFAGEVGRGEPQTWKMAEVRAISP